MSQLVGGRPGDGGHRAPTAVEATSDERHGRVARIAVGDGHDPPGMVGQARAATLMVPTDGGVEPETRSTRSPSPPAKGSGSWARRAKKLVVMAENTRLNRMRMRTALTRSVPNRPISCPMVVTARVAAACGDESERKSEAESADRRVHDEGVRGQQRAEQHRCQARVPEREPHRGTGGHRERERQHGNDDHLPAVTFDQPQIELESGHEHEVQQAELAEGGDGGVATR